MPENRTLLKHLGLGLQVMRLSKNMSQAELAAASTMRPNQVSRYETGQVLPQLPQLEKILDALKLDMVDFFIAVRLLSWIVDLTGDRHGRGNALAESAVQAFLSAEEARFSDLRQAITRAFSESLDMEES